MSPKSITLSANDRLALDPQICACLNLWTAVLLEGVRSAHNESKTPGADGPATTWVFSRRHYAGSFLWICDVLDMSPDYVRNRFRESLSISHLPQRGKK